MQRVTFVVKTRDREHLLASSMQRSAGDPNVSLEFGLARHAPGISTTEVLINVAIGIGSGIPAGVAANWLFAKLGLGRDTKLYDNTGALLASVKEIEAKLDALIKQTPPGHNEGNSAPPSS